MHRMLVATLVIAASLAACTTTAAPPADVATGLVGAWQAGPTLPTPRANHCSTVIDGWVLVIGGNYVPAGGSDFVTTDEIHAALLADDGTLGPWQLAGHTASGVAECNAASSNGTLYVVDGIYDDASDGGQIWSASFDATTGMLDTLTAAGALPTGDTVIGSVAAVRDDQLLLMDSLLPDDGNTTVTLRTPLAGAPTWSTDDWKIGFLGQAQYAFADHFAYTLGGYSSPDGSGANIVGADVYVAPIDEHGTIGAVTMTAALPTPTTFGQAVAVDDWVFVSGGRDQVFGASGTTTVVGAQVAADGTLASWQPAAALPTGRTNHQMVVDGDYLVITGGAVDGPGDDLVLVAQVRYAAATAP